MASFDPRSSYRRSQPEEVGDGDRADSSSGLAQEPFALIRLPDEMPPMVAAFEAGRLFNRLVFHGVQAPFRPVGGASHDSRFHALAGLLGVATSRLDPGRGSIDSPRVIVDAIDMARSSYLRFDHPDILRSAGDDATLLDRDRRIAGFIEPVWESLFGVRRLLMTHLGDWRMRKALRLGERLDQAAAPGQIEGRLYDPDGDDNTQLSNVDWWPGDQPPEPGCLAEVSLLAAELALSPRYLAHLEVREDAFTEAVLERMVCAIREGLKIIAEPSGLPPNRPRIEVNLDRSVIILDEDSYPVTRLGAVYVQTLLEAGDWVSRAEARGARSELSQVRHLERVCKALPRRVLNAIETTHRGSRIRPEFLGRPSH